MVKSGTVHGGSSCCSHAFSLAAAVWERMSDITFFGITLVKIILDFKPSLADPSLIRNLLYPFESYN